MSTRGRGWIEGEPRRVKSDDDGKTKVRVKKGKKRLLASVGRWVRKGAG